MPVRPCSRQQASFPQVGLPPTVDELIPCNHPARFVAAFVEEVDRGSWAGMEVAVEGDPLGVPSYDRRALLCVWLYGFMSGVRSSRKLEAACRDQMPSLWLTGWQHGSPRPTGSTLPAHGAHRCEGGAGGQAVDGTKIAGQAAKAQTYPTCR